MMFDARQASKVACDAKQNKQLAVDYADQCILDTILDQIEKAANVGDTQLYYECDYELSKGVLDKLKNLKYKISKYSRYGGICSGYYYIKWDHL